MKKHFEHYAAGENLYNLMVSPVCQKHGLTHMELTVIMFLANNPQYDTATQLVRFRRLTKSHVSVTIRSLQDRGFLKGEYLGRNRRTIHLTLCPAADPVIADGRKIQQQFTEVLFEGFTQEERGKFQQFMEQIDRNVDRYTDEIMSQEYQENGK